MAEEVQPGPLAVRTRSPGSHFCRKALGVVTGVFIATSVLFVIGIIASMDIMMPTNDANRIANHSKTGLLKSMIENALRHLSVRLFGDTKRGEEFTERDTTGAHDDHREFRNGTDHSILRLIRNLSLAFHEGEGRHSQYHLPVEDVPPVPSSSSSSSSSNDSSADAASGAAENTTVGGGVGVPALSAAQGGSPEAKLFGSSTLVPQNDTQSVDLQRVGNGEVFGRN